MLCKPPEPSFSHAPAGNRKHAVGPLGSPLFTRRFRPQEGNPAYQNNNMSAVKLARFELPNRLVHNEDTATDTYAQFVAEPFERGYGHTIGNSLRRVLLSSLEGAAITSVKIAGAQHEFSSLPGVVEDVTDIVLNLKKVKFNHNEKEPRILTIKVEKEGVVTAGDITEDHSYDVVNKDQVICTLDKKVKFDCEFEVRVGRGFSTGDENKRTDQPIGVIAIDSIFSPVTRVKYAVETTRVGQITDYDKLILDIWTDGRITPQDALLQASAILRHHLDVFVNYDENAVEFEEAPAESSEENAELKKLLNMCVNEIELSVRAANCLNNANITTVGQLAHEDRGGDAQVPQLRQEVAQRDQGQARRARPRPRHDLRIHRCSPAPPPPPAARASARKTKRRSALPI